METYFTYGEYLPVYKDERETYLKEYLDYIKYLMNREFPKDETLYEHHIVPRSFLPKDWRNTKQADKDNIIIVTYEEHKELHRILAYLYPTSGMSIAYMKMFNNNKESVPEGIRLEAGKAVSLKNKEFYSLHPEAKEHLSEIRRGKCFINNGTIERFLYPEEADEMVSTGEWSYGMIKGRSKSDFTRQKMKENCGKANRGKIHIYNPETNESKLIFEKDIEEWSAKGWRRGRGIINYTKKKIPTAEEIERFKRVNKGRIHITKDGANKSVLEEELNNYLSQGWVIGASYSEERRKKASERLKSNPIYNPKATSESNRRRAGYKIVSKDSVQKQIRPEELDKYIADGWKLGKPLIKH